MIEIELLNNWNPWWLSGKVPDVLKGVKRDLNSILFKSLKEREIIVLTGVRRSGKTTLMYQMTDLLLKEMKSYQIFYLNLDDELLKNKPLEEIYNLYRQNKNPNKKAFIFLDEIQNSKDWEKFLKKYYDMKEDIKFVISGSSAHLLKGEYSTLLTGRNLTFKIYPLSFKEHLTFEKIQYKQINTQIKNKIIFELENYFDNGGFPEAFFKEKEIKKVLLKQYFEDILYKDIISRYNINSQKITQLAVYLLTNIANTFTIRKIRNFTGLSIDSIKDYLSYLEDAYLIITLNYFSYSLKESIQMPKKCYVIDNGLRNAVSFRFSQDIGRIAENCVCIKLKILEKDIYYWRNQKHQEIDFIIKNKNQSLTAINVSYTNKIEEREINNLLEFKENFKKTKELIIITKDLEKQEQGINFIPLWKFLLT